MALGASVAVPVAIGALRPGTQARRVPASGVALTLGAAVIAGLGALLGRRWALPVIATVGRGRRRRGLVLAAARAVDLRRRGDDGRAASASPPRSSAVASTGVALAGLTLTGGHLAAAGRRRGRRPASPTCSRSALLLLGAGARARSTGTSSWIAYGPVIGALRRRGAGRAGGRGSRAGTPWSPAAVGVLAVVAGGQRRLAAPLFLGTGLLVALVAYETFAITAGLPDVDLARPRREHPAGRRGRHGAPRPLPHRDRQAPGRRGRREVRLTPRSKPRR